jgi:spermidine synthase
MKRNAFLLGLYATGGQVLILRELVSSLNGDELLIGTGLLGWLLWVALGAYLGGRTLASSNLSVMFPVGALLLPISIILTRMAPMVATGTVGEIVPLSYAAVISVVAMFPVAIVSGWMFPAICRRGTDARESIILVYLLEGIGAFVVGWAVVLLVGSVLSTLGMSIALAITIIGASLVIARVRPLPGQVVMGLVIAVVAVMAAKATDGLDSYFDSIKYRSYVVEKSFDTHYGHQTIISRDSTFALLTDNIVEAVYPDREAAENLLVPPLIYSPSASRLLIVGRAEFAVAQLMGSLPVSSVTAVDPRRLLTPEIENMVGNLPAMRRIEQDVMSAVSSGEIGTGYDVITVVPGEFSSYLNSRLITPEFMSALKDKLADGGLVFVPTNYDTDRYVTADEAELLSIVHGVLSEVFTHVHLWPGTSTLFFASDRALFDISQDSLLGRLASVAPTAQYVSEYYLADRLDPLRSDRLRAAVDRGERKLNTIHKPVLPHYQAWYRAKATGFDRAILPVIIKHPLWFMIVPLLVLVFLGVSVKGDQSRGRFGLFLFFTAGAASLSLELLAFYTYQAMAGSLFSEMAALIGAFMLGLATGTYYTHRMNSRNAEYAALAMLILVTAMFLLSFQTVHPRLLLTYYVLFLFAAAVATGSLFVAATHRYYAGEGESNRGLGYAWELIGSSAAALMTTTILLPIIGLTWLLVAVMILLLAAFAGSVLTARR